MGQEMLDFCRSFAEIEWLRESDIVIVWTAEKRWGELGHLLRWAELCTATRTHPVTAIIKVRFMPMSPFLGFRISAFLSMIISPFENICKIGSETQIPAFVQGQADLFDGSVPAVVP